MTLAIGLAILVAVAWLIRRSQRQRVAVSTPATLKTRYQPPERRAEAVARWIEPGERVILGGTAVDSGLFYFGSALPTQHGYTVDNALIDPSLPIGRAPGNT